MTLGISQQLRAERDTGFRPDIEGLRAIAVIAVLLYHADLGPFNGGYVGVDVFFVLSGFLITRLLVRDLSKSGARSLPNFWARRARRILPASALVILSTLLVGWFVLDPLTHRSLARDSIAAGGFVVNMVFARRDGDYFASELAPSPLLHFWSLAVEEQFYVIWPVVVLIAVRVRTGRRTALIATIGTLWCASFATSIWLTGRNAPWAFYLLPTRAWELLSGAAVAIAAPAVTRWITPTARAVVGWGGLVAVVASIMMLSPSAHFPGWIALWPVFGTVAVVLAGVGARGVATGDLGPRPLLGNPVMLWIGQRSYGIYLWHWPVLVLGAANWGSLTAQERAAALLISVGLAALSYELFENPIRHSPWLAFRPRRALLTGVAIISLVVASAAVVLQIPRALDSGAVAESASLALPTETLTPATTLPPAVVVTSEPVATPTTLADPVEVDDPVDLGDAVADLVAANREALQEAALTTDVPANLRPSLNAAAADKPLIYDDGCMLGDGETQPQPCVFGNASSDTRIVLFGDSHAAQWFPALHRIAEERGWRLDSITKQGCPTAEVPTTRTDRDPACARWRSAVYERLAASSPDLVIMSSYRYNPGGLADEPWRSGLDATLSKLRPLTPKLLVLGDTPTPVPKDVPTCLAQNLRSATQCIAPRSRSVVEARLSVERELARDYDAMFASTADWLCTETSCPVIFDDVLLYRDGNHISTTAAVLLSPYLEATVAAALDRGT